MSKPSTVEVELVRRLALAEITGSEFLASFPDRSLVDADFVSATISRAFDGQDPWLVQLAMIRLNVQTGSYCYPIDSSALCQLLFENWHYSHEDIAFYLQRQVDSNNLDCLYKAAQLRFDYLEYDETFQFARKCIKAISAIGSAEAFEKLRRLAGTSNKVIAAYALKELNRVE